jgi:hypothetical protein
MMFHERRPGTWPLGEMPGLTSSPTRAVLGIGYADFSSEP